MSKFKVGDRVRIYTTMHHFDIDKCILIGVVIAVHDSETIRVQRPNTSYEFSVHVKACRKLVSKPKRRVWIRKDLIPAISLTIQDGTGLGVTCVDRMGDPDWIEFLEVGKKK